MPSVIAILINATLSEEPIKDGSRMSMESIWRFIFSITNSQQEGNPYPQVYIEEEINQPYAAGDGTEYTSNASIFLWNMFNKLRMNFSA